MKCLLASALLLGATLSAGDYLPLEPGNTWTYRDQVSGETFTINVSVPALLGGQVYYGLNEYTGRRLWVRNGENGLYYRDEEREADVMLTPFAPNGLWAETPFRPCSQEAMAVEGKERYSGPVGRYGPTLRVQYRSFGCADVGVVREDYLDNIGMVRREVTTIAGPRVYELVHARVGDAVLGERHGAGFRVSVLREGDTRLIATLRLSVFGPPVRLVFPTSQEYDVQLRDPEGNVMYTWSADKAFLQAIHTREAIREFVWTVELPVADPLKPGRYTVEAWLTSGPSGREFAAATSFDVADPVMSATSTTACVGCSSTGRPIGRDR